MAQRVRRSQKEIIQDKILKIEEDIKNTEDKLTALRTEKDAFEAQLKEIEEAEERANEEAVINKVAQAIKKKKISIDDVEAFLNASKSNTNS